MDGVKKKFDKTKIMMTEHSGNYGGFHLHLLVFPFVYQFNSRIGVLVHSSYAKD